MTDQNEAGPYENSAAALRAGAIAARAARLPFVAKPAEHPALVFEAGGMRDALTITALHIEYGDFRRVGPGSACPIVQVAAAGPGSYEARFGPFPEQPAPDDDLDPENGTITFEAEVVVDVCDLEGDGDLDELKRRIGEVAAAWRPTISVNIRRY